MGTPKTVALILEESQAQMNLAKEAFDRQGDTVVIVSHLVSTILLNKAARYAGASFLDIMIASPQSSLLSCLLRFNRYVVSLCRNGLLKEGEATEFLEQLQEGLLKVHSCPVDAPCS